MSKQPKTQNHSFGKLETFEPEDKSFSKHVLKDGTGDGTPNEGSVCTLIIYTIGKVLVRKQGSQWSLKTLKVFIFEKSDCLNSP